MVMRSQGPSEVCRAAARGGHWWGRAGEERRPGSPSPGALLKHPLACFTQEVQEEELRERKKGDIDKRYKPSKIHWILRERQTGQEREENQV